MSERLTRRALDNWLRDDAAGDWLWCSEMRGFGARRRDAKRAALVVQFRIGRGRTAKRRRLVLGEYPTMRPEEGRELAASYISAGWKGVDRVAEQRATQLATQPSAPIATLSTAFLAFRRPHLMARSADQYESLWRRCILPELGRKTPAEVKRREVALLLDRLESEAGTSVADRIHEQLAIFFRWVAERDDEFVSPLIQATKRHRRGPGARPLTDDEIRQFWEACGRSGPAGAAGRFCLLTAVRRTEATAATWDEFHEAGHWRIPASRYKTKKEHVLPMSQAAAALVDGLERRSRFLFGATGSPPDCWGLWKAIEQAGGPKGDGISWHSLRKTARTIMSRAGVRAEHAERVLGHVQGAIESAYDKHTYLPEKRGALECLAAEVARIVEGHHSPNVIRMAIAV